MIPKGPSSGVRDPVLAAARLLEEARGLVLRGREDQGLEHDDRMASAAELAVRFREAAGGTLVEGRAFGGSWPVVDSPVGLLIPGVPVVVGRSENPGPDGVYRRSGCDVIREAVGEEAVAVRLDDGTDLEVGSGFALLWFGPTERFVLSGGRLIVEDLFAAIDVPATATTLERLLVRGGRLAHPLPRIAARESGEEPTARVEIRRSLELLPPDAVLDPVRLLRLRPEVERVRRSGDDIMVRRADGEPLRFTVVQSNPKGWELALVEGRHPFVGLKLVCGARSVSYRGTLHPEIDPLAPGIRSRLAFDLQADLVAL